MVGSHKRCLLGVRPTGSNADIDLNPPGDVNGDVVVNRKGMSVSSDWRVLPGHLIPEELDDGLNGASGEKMKVYVHGSGAFLEGAVTASLEMLLKLHDVDSGIVRPATTALFARFQADLLATRNDWIEDAS